MFWNKKQKLPVTIDDKEWIEEGLLFLRENFSAEHFDNLQTITPTKDFYNITFKGNEEDAEFILKRTMEIMIINDTEINLEFFSDQPVEMADGTILSTPADMNGSWKSAAGLYEEKNDEKTIYIERGQLKNTISLIATISHELSHLILLGENRIEENDEYLTDLTAIAYGFGIFIGNSRFQHSTFQNSTNFGWQMSKQGYLPEQIIAYSMAWLSKHRKESTDYKKYLNKTMEKYFTQSENYLKTEK
ncbi:hypothetical protein [Flavobacterium sp. DSP2-3-1]|uniref:hypothetical protein n=1 Tax=Flavobacterium sp. DSP2-3-1 TaxID=2804620 RepID=UPI003CEECD09